MVTKDILQQYVYYSEGNLYSNITTAQRPKGTKLGSSRKDGYIKISLLGKQYLLHRLIYLYHHGTMPDYLDHINRDNTDNRIENLRPIDMPTNAFNSNLSLANTSGIKGISYGYRDKCWIAHVECRGKKHRQTFKGSIDNILAKNKAIEWLTKVREELHGEYSCHG